MSRTCMQLKLNIVLPNKYMYFIPSNMLPVPSLIPNHTHTHAPDVSLRDKLSKIAISI